MRILYYDCFAGISGDMNLGAMVDLGVPADYLKAELGKLNLHDEFELKVEKKTKMGIEGTKVKVILHDAHGARHDAHGARHGGHDAGDRHHHHRNVYDIEKIIDGSSLSDEVKKMSKAIFMQVARAEAKIHGKSLDEIHFHEVGATDSIVDIIGAAICFDYLKVDGIVSSPVQVGGGFVECAHGVMPVPAPATAEILKGIPIKSGAVDSEATTPTGAAILAEMADAFTGTIEMVMEKTGYGLGTKDFKIPNVLRVHLGETKDDVLGKGAADDNNGNLEITQQILLETNIDDMSPEKFTYVEDLLFDEGALDVYKTPIIMKKGRPATMLSVLTDRAHAKALEEIIYGETSTLGLRKTTVEKRMLKRKIFRIPTPFGIIPVKRAFWDGKPLKCKPEYEVCARIAREQKVSYDEIFQAAMKALEENKYVQ